MIDATMVQNIYIVLAAMLIACGGAQKAGAAKDTESAAEALSAPPGEQLIVVVTSSKSSNKGRPFRVVARAVDYNTYLTDTYAAVTKLVMEPDETVQASEVIYPGHDTTLTMAKPEKDSIGLYFLFTEPDAAWKTYLEVPVSSTVTLDEHSASTPVALPESAKPRQPSQKGTGGMPKRRKLALVSGGVGAAGLITGTVLALLANSRYNEGLATCADTTAGTGCTQAGVDLGNEAQTLGLGANISFGVGAAAVIAGTVLWFTTPAKSNESAAGESAYILQPYAGPRSAGVVVRGRF